MEELLLELLKLMPMAVLVPTFFVYILLPCFESVRNYFV